MWNFLCQSISDYCCTGPRWKRFNDRICNRTAYGYVAFDAYRIECIDITTHSIRHGKCSTQPFWKRYSYLKSWPYRIWLVLLMFNLIQCCIGSRPAMRREAWTTGCDFFDDLHGIIGKNGMKDDEGWFSAGGATVVQWILWCTAIVVWLWKMRRGWSVSSRGGEKKKAVKQEVQQTEMKWKYSMVRKDTL